MEPKKAHYKLLLVSPEPWSSETSRAEEKLQTALALLNIETQEPGLRFAPGVTAELETARSIAEAATALSAGDVAMTILLNVPDDTDRRRFLHRLGKNNINILLAEGDADPTEHVSPPGLWLRPRGEDDFLINRMPAEALGGDDDSAKLELAVLVAIGVAQHHISKDEGLEL